MNTKNYTDTKHSLVPTPLLQPAVGPPPLPPPKLYCTSTLYTLSHTTRLAATYLDERAGVVLARVALRVRHVGPEGAEDYAPFELTRVTFKPSCS